MICETIAAFWGGGAAGGGGDRRGGWPKVVPNWGGEELELAGQVAPSGGEAGAFAEARGARRSGAEARRPSMLLSVDRKDGWAERSWMSTELGLSVAIPRRAIRQSSHAVEDHRVT